MGNRSSKKLKTSPMHFAWNSPKKKSQILAKIIEESISGNSSVITLSQDYTVQDFEDDNAASNEQESPGNKRDKYRQWKRKNGINKLEIKFYDPVQSENTLKPIETRPKLTHPLGIAIHKQTKHIYVTDSANNCVQVYSENLEYQFHFPRWEIRPCGDILKSPCGITIVNERIYVSEIKRNEIAVFTLNGDYIGRIDKTFLKDPNMRMKYPHGLASDAEGKIYVCDTRKGRILIFSEEMIPISLQMGIGILTRPVAIQVQNEKIFILDLQLSQGVIQIFDKDGNWLSRITKNVKSGQMTVDIQNRIYITSNQDKTVTVLEEDGSLVKKIVADKTYQLSSDIIQNDNRVLLYQDSTAGGKELVWIDV